MASAADVQPPETDQEAPRRGWLDPGAWAVAAAIVATVCGVLWLLSPRLIFTPTLATNGDLGAHVYPLREFVERLLPSGSLSGWSHGWYTGMPLYTFYFPLPALIVAALTPLAGFEIATKLMVALGPLLVPPAAWALLRGAGLGRWQAATGAVVGSMFMLMFSYSVFGGNLMSTYIGEFSYGLSFPLSLFYLGVVLRAGRTERPASLLAGTLLALTALSHVLTTAAVVAVTLPLLLSTRHARTVLGSWVTGFLLAGFWAVPFLLRLPFSSSPPWLYEPALSEIVPLELMPFLPFALGGAWVLARRHRYAALVVLGLPLVAAATYLAPQDFIHRGRFLPYGFFAVHALAGIGVGAAFHAFQTRRSRAALVVVTLFVWVAIPLNIVRDPRRVHDYVEKAQAGYPAAEDWDEYKGIVQAIADLPPGRVFWEESDRTLGYGSALGLTILPYWSPDHPVLSGLWTESALTYPFYLRLSRELSDSSLDGSQRLDFHRPFDFDRGIEHGRLMGGRYFLAYSERTRAQGNEHPGLTVRAQGDDWTVYEVGGVEEVSIARRLPTVVEGAGFDEAALLWYDSVSNRDAWVVQSGPLDWPRSDHRLSSLDEASPLGARRAAVQDLTWGPERISFRTEAVGVPHLIRASWFPNWVSVGARGPYRAAPNFMVVVPEQEEVELVFMDSWAEWSGRAATLLGLILAMFSVSHGAAPVTSARRLPYYGRPQGVRAR